jgi:hypothetical protein
LPVSPYLSTSNIEGNTITTYVACLDINNATDVGTFYSGTFGPAVTLADKEVSWLADQLLGMTPTTPNAATTAGPISMAIWQIEFASSTNSENLPDIIDPAAAPWITDAGNAVAAGYVPDRMFFTPDNAAAQRFVELQFIPAPEPNSLILLGTGLLALAAFAYRRRRIA